MVWLVKQMTGKNASFFAILRTFCLCSEFLMSSMVMADGTTFQNLSGMITQGASDIVVATLFQKVREAFLTARYATDLQNLRRHLTDINFELTKYGTLSLQSQLWKQRLSSFVKDVLPKVKVPQTFALDIKDVENDTAALIESLSESLVTADGTKNMDVDLSWHLDLAVNCAKVSSLSRVRAYGYWKLGDLRRNQQITPDNISLFLPVVVFLAEGFREDDSSVAIAAENSILELCRHFHVTNILQPSFQFAARIMEMIDSPTTAGKRDVVKFRIFDFVDKLLRQNASNLPDIVQLGIMEKLYYSFRSMDLLVLANNCETMGQFARHSAGLQLLEESGGIKLAEDLLVTKKNSTEFEYFGPYLMRMYIVLAINFPEYCILKCERVTMIAPDLVMGNEGHSAAAALEYIGQLGSCSVAGKRYLHNSRLPNGIAPMEKILQFVGRRLAMNSTKNPVDDACFRTLELLLRRLEVPQPDTDAELQNINAAWFAACGLDTFPALFRKLQNPFKDIKMPVLNIVKSLAGQRWGLEKFRDEAGFLEYLLNRSIEVDRDVKEQKFFVIRDMTRCAALTEVFDSVAVIRLREYVKDGPFYMQGEHRVAFEGGA